MQLHELKPATPRKGTKRIGRGGKRGTYSGRGQKGQRARAGHNIRPGLRDIIIRTPKLRGFKNKPKSAKSIALSLGRLNKISEARIDMEALIKSKLIRAGESVKIVSGGELKSAKQIVKIPVSADAAKKIQESGGTIER